MAASKGKAKPRLAEGELRETCQVLLRPQELCWSGQGQEPGGGHSAPCACGEGIPETLATRSPSWDIQAESAHLGCLKTFHHKSGWQCPWFSESARDSLMTAESFQRTLTDDSPRIMSAIIEPQNDKIKTRLKTLTGKGELRKGSSRLEKEKNRTFVPFYHQLSLTRAEILWTG